MFFRRGRRRLTDDLARYIRLRIDDGSFREVPDPKRGRHADTRAVAWFAGHRKGDADSDDLDDEQIRLTLVDMFVHGLVKP